MRTLLCAGILCAALAVAQGAGLGKVTVTAEQAPVMSGKQVIATAKKGEALDVTEIKGDWFGVAPSQGWIHKANVRYEPGAPASVAPPDFSVVRMQTYRGHKLAPSANVPYTVPSPSPSNDSLVLVQFCCRLSSLGEFVEVASLDKIRDERIAKALKAIMGTARDAGIKAALGYLAPADFVLISHKGRRITAEGFSVGPTPEDRQFADLFVVFGDGHARTRMEIAFCISDSSDVPERLVSDRLKTDLALTDLLGDEVPMPIVKRLTVPPAGLLAPVGYRILADGWVVPPEATALLKGILDTYHLPSLSAPCRTAIPIERVVKQYGKPQEEGKESIDTGSSRETCTVYWYGPVGIGFGEDKLVSSVFCRDRPEGFWGKLTLDEIVFPSLACVLPTQALIEGKRNLPQSSKGPSSDTQTHSNNLSSKKISSLPDYQEELSGANEVRVLNPNPFAVSAGIRSGKAGKDFEVPPHAARSVFIPDGLFDFYVVYSNRPDSLYQGDAFSLRGNGVEIQLVHVVGGNYGMRKVK